MKNKTHDLFYAKSRSWKGGQLSVKNNQMISLSNHNHETMTARVVKIYLKTNYRTYNTKNKKLIDKATAFLDIKDAIEISDEIFPKTNRYGKKIVKKTKYLIIDYF